MRRAVALALAFALGCHSDPPPPAAASPMVLPVSDEQPPEGPGREAFLGGCLVCHSYRYVATQPPFPEKVWAAEVDKMIKVYGAPIPLASAPLIVSYLVATHSRP